MHFDFEKILFYSIIITGFIWLLDYLFFAKTRATKKDPFLVDYAKSFFPILLIVFLLRSFLFEPFRIPSGSLEPSLLIGDFILVNKYAYGFRLPVLHKKIYGDTLPKHGDVLIFRWPPHPEDDFIKRVIGLPGDRISYINKVIYINGKEMSQSAPLSTEENGKQKKIENLLGISHLIYVNPNRLDRDYHDIVVPPHMYFVMGDNRDDSADSRYWGFVPEDHIVGKAMMVWLSWDQDNKRLRFKRMGEAINKTQMEVS